MTNQTHDPGPRRSMSAAAFIALKKDIAHRYEQAEKEARKPRAAREQERRPRRREDNVR